MATLLPPVAEESWASQDREAREGIEPPARKRKRGTRPQRRRGQGGRGPGPFVQALMRAKDSGRRLRVCLDTDVPGVTDDDGCFVAGVRSVDTYMIEFILVGENVWVSKRYIVSVSGFDA